MSVVVAEDSPIVAEALCELLATDSEIEVVGVAHDATVAGELCAAKRPKVALVDVVMPRGGGARAARDITAASPETRVLALSAVGDREAVIEILRAGAVGYLVKGCSVDEILQAVRRAARGESTLSPSISGEVIGGLVEGLERSERGTRERTEITQRVQSVLEEGALTSVFQPICELESVRPVGYESLARFADGRSPPDWFSEAHAVGLGTELELAAIRNSVAAALPARATRAGVDPLFLAVNASPEAILSPAFQSSLSGIDPSRVVVEVTEHAPIEGYQAFRDALAGPRAQGMRLAVDDAGAGYASLRHILQLSPELIKLDMSLTRDIDREPARRAMAASLISFAAETDATVIAEGIETPDELKTLVELDVRYGQGFHLGRPAPLDRAKEESA